MITAQFGQQFIQAESLPWEVTGKGVRRKILAYDANLMMVIVEFDAGGVGPLHQHPHVQMSYVQRGTFAITIDGEERILNAGDVFYVASNLVHGAVCREAGTLVDIFSPMREDFL